MGPEVNWVPAAGFSLPGKNKKAVKIIYLAPFYEKLLRGSRGQFSRKEPPGRRRHNKVSLE
jgi:hypothetical protein